MPQCIATLALAMLALAMLVDCGGRERASGGDSGPARDVASVTTVAGNACRTAADCPAMVCLGAFERSCLGPVRPHTWSAVFPGGYCGPMPDLATGSLLGDCPSGTFRWTAFVGCDGVPFRFCARRCAGDSDCRVAEGYRCHPELFGCAPPSFLSSPDDGGM